MKDQHDKATSDLIDSQKRRGRPNVYLSETERDQVKREKAAARQAALRERQKELEFDLSGLLRLQAIVSKHAPDESRILEKLESMIERRKGRNSSGN